MDVRVVRVVVRHGLVPVRMRVRLAGWIARRVRVPVVRIVDIQVFVLHRLVMVLVLVPLGDM